MDIKKQHLEAIESSQGFTKVDNEKAAEKCTAITEQVAIDFHHWCYLQKYGGIDKTSKELFELYKTQTK